MQTMSLIQFCAASHAVLNQECLVLKFPIELGAWPLSSVGIPNSGADPGFFLGGGALTGFIQKIATIFQGLFNDFSRTTLDFQGQPTRNKISQVVQKCIFPVYSNKTLRL